MEAAGGGGAPACGRGGSVLGRGQARLGAGEGGRGGTALLRFSRNADCSGKRPRRWLYPALPRHGSGRGRAFPRQRSAVMVAATSGLCRAAMHGAAQHLAAPAQ